MSLVVRKKGRKSKQVVVPQRALTKAVNKTIYRNTELKYFDVYVPPNSLTSTWVSYSMSNISQGDSQVTRDGNAVYIKGYKVAYRLTRADTWQKFRCLIVRALVPNNTTLLMSEILQDVGTSIDKSMLTPNNFERKKSYQILYDKIHNLQPDSGLPNYEMTYKISKRFKTPKLLKWNSSNASDYESGNLTFFALADSVAATHPDISFYSRVMFIEK